MIKIENVTKRYDKTTIIHNISMEIKKGEFVVFIGSSGCGKTTTLKMINRLIPVSSGTIEINGENIQKVDTTVLRRKMGFVIQNVGLFPHMCIEENIMFIAKMEKVAKNERHKRAKELIELVGLDDSFLGRYPSELSGGQQQRIGVARALANDPEIILMDEPFSALDPITKTQLQDEIVNIQKELGKTVLFVTHDINEALRIADKICIFENGRIAQFDTPQVILNNPASQYVIDFIGENKLWQNPEFIPVHDVMLREPVTILESTTMLDASQKMKQTGVDTLIVIDTKRKYIGILEMESLLQQNLKKSSHVRAYCNETFQSLQQDAMVDEAITLMIEDKQKLIPVVNKDQKIVGLVTRAKLFNKIGTQFMNTEEEVG